MRDCDGHAIDVHQWVRVKHSCYSIIRKYGPAYKDSSVLRVFMRGWPGKGVDAHQGWAELFAP